MGFTERGKGKGITRIQFNLKRGERKISSHGKIKPHRVGGGVPGEKDRNQRNKSGTKIDYEILKRSSSGKPTEGDNRENAGNNKHLTLENENYLIIGVCGKRSIRKERW